MFFKNQGHNEFDTKFKDNSWRSRTSGNLKEAGCKRTPNSFALSKIRVKSPKISVKYSENSATDDSKSMF